MRPADDLRELGLPPTASLGEAKRAYRDLALIRHPDKGGDPIAFARLADAYQRLKTALAVPVRCDACDGHGRVRLSSGWSTIHQRCPACRGRGKVLREDRDADLPGRV